MLQTELLEMLEPTIQNALDEHMSLPGKVNSIRQPIDPLKHLAKVTSTNDTDPHIHGPILRESYSKWTDQFYDEYGVDIKAVTASTFLVNLLTEDNLPHYTTVNYRISNDSSLLKEWVNEWTCEEDAHGVLMRDYALHAGLISSGGVIEPSEYQAGRVQQLRTGTEINPPNIYNAFGYLTLQEYLTKEAHRNLSWLLDPMGRKVMRPIAGDEQNHYEFYLKLSKAVLEIEPDQSLIGMSDVYKNFDMPGKKGIPKYNKHALRIGVSGIFDLETICKSKRQITDKLNIINVEPITDAGKHAKEAILHITNDQSIVENHDLMEGIRDSALENHNKEQLTPFILGRTIDYQYQGAVGHQRPTGFRRII